MKEASVHMDHTHTILLVGDDPGNLGELAKTLMTHNCRVLCARNGAIGIERAAYDQPDLIFLDVMMPDFDGFETCRRLKENNKTRCIPVILMTRIAEAKTIVKGFHSGAVDYITKPFLREEITARIRTHLFGNSAEMQLESSEMMLGQEIAKRRRAETKLKKYKRQNEQKKLNEAERMRRALLSIIEDEKIAKTKIIASEEALTESQRRLQSLSSHLLEAQEKNWRRIAMELHDELGQSLTVLKLKLRNIRKIVPPDSALPNATCEDANAYVDHIIDRVRRLSQELCPSYIEDLGLDESIVILAEEFAKHTGLEISIHAQEIDDCFDLQERTFIYRIVQESLNNIQKHAQARSISIQIKRKKSRVDIQIVDDGIGFSQEGHKGKNEHNFGLGLTAMAERARMLGGKLQLHSIIGMGTRIEVTVPID